MLKDKLRLFEAVVTPTILYGAAAWTLTEDMEMLLRTARRKMMRLIFGAHRRRKRLENLQEQDGHTVEDNGNDSITTSQRSTSDDSDSTPGSC